MTDRKKYALIVAGGKGMRMGADVPKQFLVLKGMPVLMHTIGKFSEAGCDEIILVLPEQQTDHWKELCAQYRFNIPHRTITGGNERFDSVKNGLNAISTEGYVAIHDGVRPCITPTVISNCFADAATYGCAVASVKPKDSLRMTKDQTTVAVNRDLFHIIQTPQVFGLQAIKNAYGQPFSPGFTDDASVFEAAGNAVYLTPGDYRNIKITTSEDLVLAESFL